MSNKVVVCGGGGYVGRALVKKLAEYGHEVVSVQRQAPAAGDMGVFYHSGDLRELTFCKEICRDAKWVFNLAASVGGIGYIGNHKATCMLSSVINCNLLQAAAAAKVDGYFFASSSCVYPALNAPLQEYRAYPANPMDGYGWEKLFGERTCLAFQSEYNLPVSIGRYHTIYGPGDVRPAGRDHVTAALCNKVIHAKLSGDPIIEIWGNGKQTRSFLYIDDCVTATLRLMINQVHEPVNIANREKVSVNYIVDLLEDFAGIKLERKYILDAPTGLQDKETDNTLIKSCLNWEPSTSIVVGLRKMYDDFWVRALRNGV